MEDQNIGGISERELKFGYWWLTHQEIFKKFIKIAVGAIAGIFWLITFYQLAIYIIGLPQDRELPLSIVNTNIDFASFFAKHKLEPLIFSEPQVIYSGNNLYDIVASVSNPNLDRGVKNFEYRFISGDFISATQTAVILPGQKIYLLVLANQSNIRLNNASLEIIKTVWQGLTERRNLSQSLVGTSDIETDRQSESGRYSITFTATNNSTCNFWQADFEVILWNQQKIVGINKTSIESFISGEQREITISWFEPLPRVDRVEIVPIIDVYHADNEYVIPGEAHE